jgi:hypothetical protein
MFCNLSDWASYLLLVGGILALYFHNHNLVKRTEDRVNRQRDEREAWNKLSPEEQGYLIIYGEHDVRPEKGKHIHTL